MTRRELAMALLVIAAASCRSKSDAPAQAVASAAESAAPAPTDPDEVDRAGAPIPAGSGVAPGSGSPDRDRAALPLPPNSMPDPPPLPTMRPDAGGYTAIVAIFDGYGFPPHPRLDHLCAKRVYQQRGRHLTWDAFASNDEPQNLVAHYRSRLGDPGFSPQGDGGVWRLPAGARTPTRTLTILRTGQLGPHEACNKKPAADAKSVLIVSRDH